MKHLPLNEKHLADKLQNVPVPDVDRSWEQMRKLLDRDMPEPAGAWSGNRKWWWVGITAVIVMVAAWLATPVHQGAHKVVAEKKESKEEKKETFTPKTSCGKKETITFNRQQEKEQKEEQQQKQQQEQLQQQERQQQQKEQQEEQKQPYTKTISITQTTTTKHKQPNRLPVITQSQPDQQFVSTSNTQLPTSNTQHPTSNEIEPYNINLTLASAEQTSPANAFNELKNNQPSHLAIPGKTDKAFARDMRKKSMKDDNRRLSRASMRGNSREADRDLTFAAGLALPQSFAISGQQQTNYNIAAKSNRISDYLPAPYFQYHLNDKVFLQTEFHFQSPQYTQRLLLSQTLDTLSSIRHETSQHLEKLYYFNIPFNIYYSPVRNFFIGGGLQYSSLLGGVATYEDKRSQGSNVLSYNSVSNRFKDDSVASVFRPSEWRYQFDASYYFNRFSLGMRYNQAMKDFINMQVGPGTTVGRNKSFLIYLRFNIWEERKKTND